MKSYKPILVLFALFIVIANSMAIAVNEKARARVCKQIYSEGLYFYQQQDYLKALVSFNKGKRIGLNAEQFEKEILNSLKGLFKVSLVSHAKGDYVEAKRGYELILRVVNSKLSSKSREEENLSRRANRFEGYAKGSFKPQDFLSQAKEHRRAGQFHKELQLYLDARVLYPKELELAGLINETAEQIFEKAKAYHLAGNFEAATLLYENLIKVFFLDKARLSRAEVNLELAKNKSYPREKIAYLTFDDGPSLNTERILEILSRYNIKATFFVTGSNSTYAKKLYQKILLDDHLLGNHTYSHRYDQIYRSIEAFKKDFFKLESLLYEIVGVRPKIIRYPGGSKNLTSHKYGGIDFMPKLIAAMEREGYIHFDWNVDSLDAKKIVQDKEVIVSAVLAGVKDKDMVIVLMHDTIVKTTTVEALPIIVEGLLKEGFVFKTLASEL